MVSISIFLLVILIFKWLKIFNRKTKLETIREDLKKIKHLKEIMDKKGFHPVHFIKETNRYPQLNEYIDEYFKIYPGESDIKNKSLLLIISSTLSKSKSTVETVKILIKHGANVNFKEETGRTSLMFTVFGVRTNISCNETVELLLKNNANVNEQDNEGLTPLHLAAGRCEDIDTMELLLKYGANPNITNTFGHTCIGPVLFRPKFKNREKFIELLIEYGCDIDIKDKKGLTMIVHSFNRELIHSVLPTRKKFLQKIYGNIIGLQKHWRVKPFDFKINISPLSSFRDTLHFL